MANKYFESEMEFKAMQQAVVNALLALNDEQLMVVYYRYYTGCALERAAELMDISRERERKLEAGAMRTLRKPKHVRELRDFV